MKRALALVFAAFLLVTPIAAESGRPDFSGTWQLNEELSDNVREKMREAMRARMRRGGGMRGRGRRGAGGRGGISGLRERMREMQEAVKQLTIVQGESELTITNASDREQHIFLDGREQTRDGAFGTVDFEAAWKKRSLVITEKTEQGAATTRTYSFRRGDAHLYVNVKVEGRGPAFDYQRVYDRIQPEAPPQTPDPPPRRPFPGSIPTGGQQPNSRFSGLVPQATGKPRVRLLSPWVGWA